VKLPIPERLALPSVSKWDAVKAFFVYSKVVALARIQAILGFVGIVAGTMDWSPLLGVTNFDTKQVVWLGGISFVHGIATEIARRYKTTTSQTGDP
jgi:hypothetical protein